MVKQRIAEQPSSIRNIDPAGVSELIGMTVLTARRLMSTPPENGGIPSSNVAVDPKSKRQFWKTSEADILEWQERRQAGAKPKPKTRGTAKRKTASAKTTFDVLTGEYT